MLEKNIEIKDSLHFTPYQHFKVTVRFIKDSMSELINDILKCGRTKVNYHTRGNVVYRIFGEFGEDDYKNLLRKGQEGFKEILKEKN